MTQAGVLNSKTRQSLATKERLLSAASDEFQRFGFAGARVDRIAAAASANKRLIYVYFGDKERLFDAVVARNVEAMLDEVPLRADDLPAYAADLLDYLEDHSHVSRLFTFRNLERPTASVTERQSYQRKIGDLTSAQNASLIDDSIPAMHLLALILGIVGSWALASPALTDMDRRADDRATRKAMVYQAVERLITPSS